MTKRTASLIACLSLASIAGAAGETISYPAGETKLSGYLALPAGKGPFPAVIVVPEWWGLNAWVKENCDLLASKGYVALGIDIYRGKETTNAEEAHELMRGLPEDRAMADLKAAFAFLATRADVKPERIGSIGWCMGGGYSLALATSEPKLAACVVNYGRIVTDPAVIAKIKAPVLGIFGATDRGIPVADVKAFAAALEKAGGSIELHVYEGRGHAFIRPGADNKEYHEADAKDAWAKTFAFLDAKLKK